jgi:putative membrane protein
VTTLNFDFAPPSETFAAVEGVVAQRGWDDGHMHLGWGGWIAMALMMAIFWAAVAAIVVWVVRSTRHPAGPAGGSSALDIARERYARGEITDEEFQRIKRGLS